MHKKYDLIMMVLALIIIVSFFLPWVSVQSQQVGAISKLLTGKSQATIDSISGFRVPILANGPNARLMLSIIKIFNPSVKDADKKSYAVWGIPLLAFIIFALSKKYGKNKIFNIIIGALGCAIFFVALFKILTTDLNKLVLNVKIEYGMWFILCGFLGMGAVNLLNLMRKD